LAIAAVLRGQANGAQQKRAMRYLLGDLAGVLAIEPASISDSERAFVSGRRWVGMCFAALGGARLLGFDAED
jgi:hypothetical protein